jgi:hypothetical protein
MSSDRTTGLSLGLRAKALLIVQIWIAFARIRIGLRRRGLPGLVRHLGKRGDSVPREIDARRLGRIVFRVLNIGPVRTRCLSNALVLYTLLHERGLKAELVIGLPSTPTTKDAHAWVELNGADMGPPPGRGCHSELARYR